MGSGAFAVAALLVPVVRQFALRHGFTDSPGSGKLHRAPTPFLGGLAIMVAAILGGALAPDWQREAAVLLAGAVCVSLLGLFDDVRPLGAGIRLGVEAGAAVAAFAAGCRVDIGPEAVDLVLTVVGIVLVTNAFNLLDNCDGAMGSVGFTVALSLTAAALLEGQFLVGGLAAALAGATLGFLVHNWPPASIFMGDSGSLLVGFLLAAVALKLRTEVAPPESVVAVGLLVAPAVFDTTLVVVSRVRAGRSVLVGGTDHTSHRLLRLGLSLRATVLLLVVGSATSGALGVGVARGYVDGGPAAVIVGAVAVAALARLLQVPCYGAGATRQPAAC